MRIIDTHCHAAPVWYEPVESLLYQMDQHEIEQAVLVQIRGYFDNDYQFECEKRYPGRFVSVVLVDVGRPDAVDQLERLAGQGARGVRLAPDDRSPGADPLAIWRKAAELGLSVSCGGSSGHFAAAEFAQLVASLPTLPIIIEHLASLKATGAQLPPEEMRRQIWSLARYPNVYMKIHGLGEICHRNLPVTTPFPFDPAGLTILHEAYAAFGAPRMMWGSDYPPVSGREGYAAALRFPQAEFASLSETERILIFGGVAAKLYGLQG
jgi:L-fuconolactonase